MSTEQPYMGCRISLISKSEIRYEGILYTIDTQECTVALAKVRSFGTEDRTTDRPVAPRDEVYEYIIFRGTDIKDIRVCDPPKPTPPPPPIGLPQDPAILTHSMAMPSATTGLPMGFKQTFGPIGGLAYAAYPGPMMPQVQPFTTLTQPTTAPSAPTSESAGSRTTTPTKRKSPTMDQGTQVSGVTQAARRQQPQRLSGGQVGAGTGRGRGGQAGFGGQRQQQQPPQRQQQQQQQLQQLAQQQQNYGPPGSGRGRGRQRSTPSVGGGSGTGMGSTTQVGVAPRGAGGAVGSGRSVAAAGAPATGGQARPRSSTTLNFPGEYDFEQANAEFQELENKFAKAKINDKRDDSGNETAAGDGEQEEDPVFYDKAKSFFDSISCEAIERSRGAFKRPDWRQERKLNVETFGVETNYRRRGFRGGRGGFRGGRGGYYGRGGGGGAGRFRGRGGQMGFQRSSGIPSKDPGTPGRMGVNDVTATAGSRLVANMNKDDTWS